MSKIPRKMYFKPIGELTQKEWDALFRIPIDTETEDFKKTIQPIAQECIAEINTGEYIENANNLLALILGMMECAKKRIPENALIILFGEPSSGKSHIINLICQVREMDLKQIKESDREFFGYDQNDCSADRIIKALKEMVDSITIVKKKTTRPPRSEKLNKPEIQEGVPRDEVEKCEFTYEKYGELYGFSKQETDRALAIGNALVIVNRGDSIWEKLNSIYEKNLLPIYLYRSHSKEEWISNMQQSNRTPEEINKRGKGYGQAREQYGNIIWNNQVSHVIINTNGANNRRLLVQLLHVLEAREKEMFEEGR